MNKTRKISDQEAIKQIVKRFWLSKEMIDLINNLHTEDKLKMLDLYNSYFDPKKGERKNENRN